MSKLLEYSGITTKVKAMKSTFIKYSEYQVIANLETVSDFVTYLKNHPGYGHIFQGMDEHDIHRGQAEDILKNGLYTDFMKLYQFATIEQRKFLNIILFQYEVNIIKDCIKQVFRQGDTYNLSMFEAFFHDHSKINIRLLASSKSMEEFMHNLMDTPYFHLFEQLSTTNYLTPFDYETQLDIYYYKKVWKLKDKYFTSKNRKVLTHCLGIEIDLQNIMWLYRSKKYYDIKTSDLYSRIVPINYKLTKEQLTKLIETITTEDFTAVLKETFYLEFSNAILTDSMEAYYSKHLLKINQYFESKFPYSMAPVQSYLFTKQSEINRLTTALECIRYKLEPQETLRYIT